MSSKQAERTRSIWSKGSSLFARPDTNVGFGAVFSKEWSAIVARRERSKSSSGDGARSSEDWGAKSSDVSRVPPSGGEAAVPSPEPSTKLGLVGLALSGGGIRSATFGLGVLQGLGDEVLRRVDYLSTVSGGGFVGATWSSVGHGSSDARAEGTASPFAPKRGQDSDVVRHLRDHCSYLSLGGPFDVLRLPALVLRGLLLNVLMLLPWLVLAVLLTEVGYTAINNAYAFQLARGLPLLLVVPFIALLLLTQLVPRLSRRNFVVSGRYERMFLGSLALGVVGVLGHFAVRYVIYAVDNHEDAERWVRSVLQIWSAVFAVALVAQLGRLSSRLRRFARRMLLVVIGSSVPLALSSAYVVLCTRIIPSPVVPLEAYLGALPLHAAEVPRGELRETLSWLDEYELRPVAGSLRLSSTDATCRSDARANGASTRSSLEACLVRECARSPASCSRWAWTFTDAHSGQDYRLVAWREEDSFLTGPETKRLYLALDRLPWSSLTVFHLEDLWRTLAGEPEHATGEPSWGDVCWVVSLGLLLLGMASYLLAVDANAASLHGFYRDCLARAFVLERRGGRIDSKADVKLSSLAPALSGAPYPLLNATLNVRGATESTLRGRQGTSFVFSPEFVGSERTGYVSTSSIEDVDPAFTLASAVAVSAAAAGPSMGAYSSGWLAPLFVMLNLRLGYWLPHPKAVAQRFRLGGRPGARHILREAVGAVNDEGGFVHVSDGGHFENLGAYELIRRKCRLVVVVDGEQDPEGHLGGLTTLMRLVRIDFGATILANVASLRGTCGDQEKSAWIWAKIRYADGEEGELLYLKATLTGDEPEYVRAYGAQTTEFPHESTADQFFTETQFECYRALGEHIGSLVRGQGALEARLDEVVSLAVTGSGSRELVAPRPDLERFGVEV